MQHNCHSSNVIVVALYAEFNIYGNIFFKQELDHVVEELEKIAVVNLLQRRSIISLIGNVQRSSLILEKVECCIYFILVYFKDIFHFFIILKLGSI